MPHLLPVTIKPHLIPFLYKEFKGVEATYYNQKVKAVKISSKSNLGKIINLLVEKSHIKPQCDTTAPIFFLIQDRTRRPSYEGNIMNYADGRNSYLMLPELGVKIINEILSTNFDIAINSFIEGWEKKKGKEGVLDAIMELSNDYQLFEFGFTIAGIRRKYYRWMKEKQKMNSVVSAFTGGSYIG